MSEGLMSGLTLVRFWLDGFHNEIGSHWVDWDNGWFHTKADGPLAERLCEAAMGTGHLMLTVYSTEELLWTVQYTHVTNILTWDNNVGRMAPVMTVHCVPWVTAVRKSLASDGYLVSLWLQAEALHGEGL